MLRGPSPAFQVLWSGVRPEHLPSYRLPKGQDTNRCAPYSHPESYTPRTWFTVTVYLTDIYLGCPAVHRERIPVSVRA